MQCMKATGDISSPVTLVVDDEDHVCQLLSRWLSDAGYRCLQARCSSEVCEIMQDHDVALLTLDYSMPNGTGLTLLEWLSEKHPETAVVMLTGQANTDVAVAALTGGACAFLEKPATREKLLFHVRRGLERRSLILDKRNHLLQLESRVRLQTRALQSAYEDVIHRLVSACCCRDVETGGHVRRTGLLSEALASAAGWSAAEAENMRLAAPMHDIGKIGIPDAILQKPGILTAQEFEMMKQHTVMGADMLAGSDSALLQLAQTIALCHHEMWNGGGYPNGLRGREIPEAARIVAIVDVFDALTHGRVYRPALSEAEALSLMIEKSGSHFDPDLLELFLSELPHMQRIAAENADEPRMGFGSQFLYDELKETGRLLAL